MSDTNPKDIEITFKNLNLNQEEEEQEKHQQEEHSQTIIESTQTDTILQGKFEADTSTRTVITLASSTNIDSSKIQEEDSNSSKSSTGSDSTTSEDILLASILPPVSYKENFDENDIDAFFTDDGIHLALQALDANEIEKQLQHHHSGLQVIDEEEQDEDTTVLEEGLEQAIEIEELHVLSSEGILLLNDDLIDNHSWYHSISNEGDVDPQQLELLPPQEYTSVFFEEEEGSNNIALESIFDNLTIGQELFEEEIQSNGIMYDDNIFCLPCNENEEERAIFMRNNCNLVDALHVDNAALDLESQDENMMFTEEELSESKKSLRENCIGRFEKNQLSQEDSQQKQQQRQLQPRGKPEQLMMRKQAQSVKNDVKKNDDTYPNQYPIQHQSTQILHQVQSFNMAQGIIDSFKRKKNERQCFGHKEIIFGLSLSPCGRFCASASQDSTICIWDVEKNSLVSTLKGHDKESECLRVTWASPNWISKGDGYSTLASGGADGVVKVWNKKVGDSDWSCVATLDHKNTKHEKSKDDDDDLKKVSGEESQGKDDIDIPQIYAIQFIDQWCGLPSINSSCFISSSDDFIHLWKLVDNTKDEKMNFEKVMEIKFTHLEHGYGGVFVHFHNDAFNTEGSAPITKYLQSSNIITNSKAFGGDRNPDNLVYVFDAEFCPSNNLLGVALSDGTLRLVNGRGVCVTILQLPGCQSHLTSFSWDKTGERLATCVATGHVILWQLHFATTNNDQVRPSCRAVLVGGHTERRPLYGAKYFGGDNENLLLSWSVDGTLCIWNSYAEGEIFSPLGLLLSNNDYPIYAVDVKEPRGDSESSKGCIAVCGGREASFLGVPIYLFDYSI